MTCDRCSVALYYHECKTSSLCRQCAATLGIERMCDRGRTLSAPTYDPLVTPHEHDIQKTEVAYFAALCDASTPTTTLDQMRTWISTARGWKLDDKPISR